MISQASSVHLFDPHHHHHHLTHPQAHHLNQHHRQLSAASSISSLDQHQHQPHYHDPFVVPSAFAGSVSAGAAFGGVPVSAESFHHYPPQQQQQQHQHQQHHHHHHRSSSTSSSSSPYTEPTSISEGGNSPDGPSSAGAAVQGGRKPSQPQMMRRARQQASSPYPIRTDQPVNWSIDTTSTSSGSSSLPRSHSVVSDGPSSTEEEIAELLRSQSRESSVADWKAATQAYPTSDSHPHHHHQTGLGSAGTFMDPYAAVANVHGHAGAFGPTMVSIGNGVHNNLSGVIGPASIVGGMGTQMGRMTLDSSETYEALAHHIRTAITTSAADRARQAFVQAWLNSSYIAYTDGNVSRQGLYGSYLRICQQYDIKPINSASFGKAVRQSFPNIKTRRLGVRGNSKYHYCGIRPATAKEAEILMNLSRNEQPEPMHGSRTSSSVEDDLDSDESSSRRVSFQTNGAMDGLMTLDGDGSQPQTPRTARPNLSPFGSQQQDGISLQQLEQQQQQLVELARPPALPFPSLEDALSGGAVVDLDHQSAREFWKLCTDHCKGLLDSVKSYRFDQFELSLRTFWVGLDPRYREWVTHPVLMSLVYRADAVVYDEILDYLHSQALAQMPQQAFGSLRQLAQSMEQVIIIAMEGYPSVFVGPKIELAARFGHLIVRHLGICQLAQALSGVFSNPNSLKEMAEAWDGIDFEAVRNQAALVTNCQHDLLGACFEDFRSVLVNPGGRTIEDFIRFVEKTYERCLEPSQDGERGLSPRSLLVRWCFVSSQLIRDLTLRSASSFGSFQIVNLFFDEWLGFKVLRKVALHVAAVAASVDATTTSSEPVFGGVSEGVYGYGREGGKVEDGGYVGGFQESSYGDGGMGDVQRVDGAGIEESRRGKTEFDDRAFHELLDVTGFGDGLVAGGGQEEEEVVVDVTSSGPTTTTTTTTTSGGGGVVQNELKESIETTC